MSPPTPKPTPPKEAKQSTFKSGLILAVIVGVAAVAWLFVPKDAPNGPIQSEFESKTTNFVKWMATRGLKHDGTEIVEPLPGNRDVFATKDFKRDEIVMLVPHQVTIHDAMAKASDPIIASYASKYPKSDWVSIIAAFILLHRNDPLWQPYLAFLPTNYSTPLYWTTEELTVIDGTDLSVDLVGQRDEIQREWNQWKSLLDLESSKESLGLRSYPVAPLNYDAFLISWHHVMSRVWTLPVGDLTNKAVMIPMVDVANHYGKPKVKIEYNKEKGAVTMTATQQIKAGEQVDVTYGEDSSYKSLKYMGFTIPNNDRNEDCRIQLIRGPHDSFPRPKKWCLFHANHKLEKTIQSCHMGKPMELETLTRVRDLVITKLRSYPTSIKADTEILKSGEGSTNFVNGVRERRGEKVCLVAVRKRLDSLIKSKKK